MSGSERSSSLTHLARLGFTSLSDADALLNELETEHGVPREAAMHGASVAADPDEALNALARIARRDAEAARRVHEDAAVIVAAGTK